MQRKILLRKTKKTSHYSNAKPIVIFLSK